MSLRRVVLSAVVLALTAAASPTYGAEDQVVVSGTVDVARGETVGDVVLVDGSVRVAGRVDGDLVVISGPARISGTVDGDVTMVSGRADVAGTGRVDGDLLYGDERPVLARGSVVTGEVSDEGWSDLGDVPWALIGGAAIWIAVTLSTLVLGLFMVALAPRLFESAGRVARERTGEAVAWGIAVVIGVPILVAIAGATLVGLPLAVAMMFALLPLAAVAYVTAAAVLGQRVARGQGPYVQFALGWAILRGVAILPIVGLLAGLAATVVGLGLLVLVAHAAGARRAGAPPPVAGPEVRAGA